MKRSRTYKFLLLIIIFNTLSCETNEDKKLIAGLIGGAVGAYVGAELGSGIGKNITTVLGGTIGYLIGTKIANILTVEEQQSFNETINKTLENNDDKISNNWSSETNSSKTAIITPLNSYEEKSKLCRDFKKVVKNKNNSVEETSKACRDSNGNWQII